MGHISKPVGLVMLTQESEAQVAWAESFAGRHRALAERLGTAEPIAADVVVDLLDEAVDGLARQASLLQRQNEVTFGVQEELDALRCAVRELVASGLADAVIRERDRSSAAAA